MKVSNIHEFAHQESGGGRGGGIKISENCAFYDKWEEKKRENPFMVSGYLTWLKSSA